MYIRNELQCPHDSILKLIQKKSIPIILGSDAHTPDEVGSYFQVVLEKLKLLGYTYFIHFNQRKRASFTI